MTRKYQELREIDKASGNKFFLFKQLYPKKNFFVSYLNNFIL